MISNCTVIQWKRLAWVWHLVKGGWQTCTIFSKLCYCRPISANLAFTCTALTMIVVHSHLSIKGGLTSPPKKKTKKNRGLLAAIHLKGFSQSECHELSVQFLDRSSQFGGGGEEDMRDDSAEILSQYFSAEGPCEQLWQGQGCPFFDIVHPAFPLWTTSLTLQGTLKDGFGEVVMVCDLPKPCKFPSLWQLPEEVPVDPQGSWSCSAPSHWSSAPNKG